jgi:hypothetical protein
MNAITLGITGTNLSYNGYVFNGNGYKAGDISDNYGITVQEPLESLSSYYSPQDTTQSNPIDVKGIDDVVLSLLQNSPIFQSRVEETLKHLGENRLNIVLDPAMNHHGVAYTDGQATIYLGKSYLKEATDANGNFLQNDNGETVWGVNPDINPMLLVETIVHELGHLDPRNSGTDNNIFSSNGNPDVSEGDHDPQQSQYIAGIMNEYLTNTNQSYSQNYVYIDTGLPTTLERDDYSVDSLFDKDAILNKYAIGNQTLDTIYKTLLENLLNGQFDNVDADLQNLGKVTGSISEKFKNPQTDVLNSSDYLMYQMPVLEWTTDFLVNETFDNRLGEQDTDLERDVPLKIALQNYLKHLQGNTASGTNNNTILESFKKSGDKFFLNL